MIGVYSAGMGIGASLSAGLVVPAMHAFHQSWNDFSNMVGICFYGYYCLDSNYQKSKHSQESLEKSTGQKVDYLGETDMFGSLWSCSVYNLAFIIPSRHGSLQKYRIWDIVMPTPQQRSLFFCHANDL